MRAVGTSMGHAECRWCEVIRTAGVDVGDRSAPAGGRSMSGYDRGRGGVDLRHQNICDPCQRDAIIQGRIAVIPVPGLSTWLMATAEFAGRIDAGDQAVAAQHPESGWRLALRHRPAQDAAPRWRGSTRRRASRWFDCE